jgi:hypothetical protein
MPDTLESYGLIGDPEQENKVNRRGLLYSRGRTRGAFQSFRMSRLTRGSMVISIVCDTFYDVLVGECQSDEHDEYDRAILSQKRMTGYPQGKI